MRLSTRNQLAGTVQDVQLGGIMSAVKVALGTGEVITAAITREPPKSLDSRRAPQSPCWESDRSDARHRRTRGERRSAVMCGL
jgi:molybdopterin-binding protein